jgi:hypothetical protein
MKHFSSMYVYSDFKLQETSSRKVRDIIALTIALALTNGENVPFSNFSNEKVFYNAVLHVRI